LAEQFQSPLSCDLNSLFHIDHDAVTTSIVA